MVKRTAKKKERKETFFGKNSLVDIGLFWPIKNVCFLLLFFLRCFADPFNFDKHPDPTQTYFFSFKIIMLQKIICFANYVHIILKLSFIV